MAKDLYEACDFKENKELIYFDGAEHANSEKSNPQKYIEEVKSFIDNLKI
jgi:alpha-beta hydrolase superfamily lysophospholipase